LELLWPSVTILKGFNYPQRLFLLLSTCLTSAPVDFSLTSKAIALKGTFKENNQESYLRDKSHTYTMHVDELRIRAAVLTKAHG
jgi:hypothetical protein